MNALDNPASFAIPYNEIVSAYFIESKKFLKKSSACCIERKMPDGSSEFYYETSIDGYASDDYIIKLSLARLYYEAACLKQAYELDQIVDKLSYFSSVPWLKKFVEGPKLLPSLLNNPNATFNRIVNYW